MERRRLRDWARTWCGWFTSLALLSSVGGGVSEGHHDGPTPSPSPACFTARGSHRFLMLVSTMDGKVAALDVQNAGKVQWNMNAGTGPLLSSSITKLEIKRDGQNTRLIPSLDGSLYQFDGENIEPVPFTADTLLSSSFRFTDESTIVGGKDSIKYGIDANTGQMRYACSIKGCKVFGTDPVKDDDDILVITRSTKTVRAVEMRSGGEKWNYSVGQHEMEFLPGSHIYKNIASSADYEDEEVSVCPGGEEASEEEEEAIEDVQLKVLVPNGLVVAISKKNPDKILWQHQFTSAIAKAWTVRDGTLREMDMFDERYVPALTRERLGMEGVLPPSLYIGQHENQLYVQPSVKLARQVAQAARQAAQMGDYRAMVPKINWRPYLASSPSRTPIMIGHSGRTGRPEEDDHHSDYDNEHALAIRHSEYPYEFEEDEFHEPQPPSKDDRHDMGYYLFSDCPLVNLPADNKTVDLKEQSFQDVIQVSLLNWWKEVAAISILTSILVHLLITRYFPGPSKKEESGSGTVTMSTGTSDVGQQVPTPCEEVPSVVKPQEPPAPVAYISRYETDFLQEHCLGKGGFGVVFQAKNRIDDCAYAVKRISLPNSEGAREKMMREVKALAKLEHGSIVRYYQAWFESPPPGWQEERDKSFEDSECLTPTPCNTVQISESIDKPLHKIPSLHFNPLRPFGGLASIEDLSPVSNKTRDFTGSVGFSPHAEFELDCSRPIDAPAGSEEKEESGSFSLGIGVPGCVSHMEDSFEVEFRNSETEMSMDSKSKGSETPFKHYKSDFSAMSDSFDIVFEDSGCQDKSANDSCDIVFLATPGGHSENSAPAGLSKGCALKNSKIHQQKSNVKSVSISALRPSSLDVGDTPESKARNNNEKKSRLYLYIQMQLCRRESLKDWLNANTLYRDRYKMLDIFEQICSAVEYVHDSHLMHRDLKPSNIFFSLDGEVKVGDFGLVTALEGQRDSIVDEGGSGDCKKQHTDQVGTRLYMSPEQLAGKCYSYKVDIFSLGLIFFELFYPFATQMERVTTLTDARNQRFPSRFMRELPHEYNFVKWLLSSNPEDRPDCKDIWESPFMTAFCAEKQAFIQRTGNRSRTRTMSSSGDSLGDQPQGIQ